LLSFHKNDTKFWDIKFEDDDLTTDDENKIQEFEIELFSSSITNKFYILTNFIKSLSTYHFNDFDKWFYTLLMDMKYDDENRHKILLRNIPQLKEYVNEYLEHVNFDYGKFVDESKAKKNSILFKKDEIEMIMHLSSYLKIYSFIQNSTLRFGKNFNKIIFNELAKEISKTDIIFKIYSVISTRTFRYNMTDRYMWDYIKMIQCKDIGVHVIEIFNFIMNYIIVLSELNKNPITYFVTVIDESIKWFLRSVYKNTIIYDDNISNEDIKTSSLNNLKVYTYNDTLEKLTSISMNRITEIIEKKNILIIGEDEGDEKIIKFQNGLSYIKFISPLTESLTYPLMAKITEVPYNYFKVLKPKFAALISAYTYYILEEVFATKYPYLFKILLYYPSKQPSHSTTYKIKLTEKYINNQNKIKSFYGFDTKPFLYDKLCHIVGRISRLNFKNLVDGTDMMGTSIQDIEMDAIMFYSNYFAGNFEKEIEKMKCLIDKDF